MDNIKKYNIFILISTFSRNIIEIFSILILYKLGFSLKDILIFYIIYNLGCLITSSISLYLSNKINPKYILVFSSIIYAYSFYYLSNMTPNLTSLIIFAILLSIGNYTYHPIRHLYALNLLDNNKNKNIANILIYNYLAIILATYLGSNLIDKMNNKLVVIILIITSLISIIPLLFIKNSTIKEKISLKINLNLKKTLFFILEQFKVIFLLLQPLYLYLYIDNSVKYVGIFNIILGISAIITIYLFAKSNTNKFNIINTIFCLILILKINIDNKNILLILALLEGIGIKIFEVVSTKNIYNTSKENIISYLIIVEIIFCLTQVFIFLLFYFINNLKIMLYICIFAIFLCGILNPKIDNEN